nr:hypothetical protein [uncultured Desulfobulbus sp.]
MKTFFKLFLLAAFALLTTYSHPSHALTSMPPILSLLLTQEKAAANLEGEWFLSGSDLEGNHTWDGAVTLNSFGLLTSGTLNSSEGPVYTFTAGNLQADEAGKITGSLIDSDATTTNFTMQLDPQKNIMAGEGNTNENENGLFVFIKKSTGVTLNNLEGQWFLSGSDLEGNHTWDGDITLNSSGVLTSGTLNSSEGPVYTFTSGTLQVDDSGKITGSLTDSDATTTNFTMQLDPQKNFMAGEGNTNENENGLFVFIKKSTGVTLNNLEGQWFLSGSDLEGNHTWDGVISLNSSGVLTSGTLNSSEGPVYTFTNGTLQVDDSGKITGSLTDSDATTTNFTMQLDPQKNIMAGEGNTNENENGLFIFIKRNTDLNP